MKSKWINGIAIAAWVFIMLYVFAKRYVIDESKLFSNHRFTIATVYKISYPVDGGADADYEYCVDKINYKGYEQFDPQKQKIKVGARYLMKYYPPNPKVARIIFDRLYDTSMKSEFLIDTCKAN